MIKKVGMSVWEAAGPDTGQSDKFECIQASDLDLIPGVDDKAQNSAWSLAAFAQWLKHHGYHVAAAQRNTADNGWLALCNPGPEV